MTRPIDPEPTRAPARPEAVKSAARTIDILEILAASEQPLSLTELQRELDVPKSSLHGLLRTLVARGWVQTDSRRTTYSVGLRALRAGATFLDRDPVVQVANAALTRLRTELDETVHLARLDGAEIVYLASRESPHFVRVSSRLGRRLPAHATALGKAVLAAMDPHEVATLLPTRLESLTPHTVTDFQVLRSELEDTRLRGWAREVEQTTLGLTCVAVAIPAWPTVDAVSCSIPLARATVEHLDVVVGALLKAAGEIAVMTRTRMS